MQSATLINDEMTLEEKLKAIDEAIKNAQVKNNNQGQDASAPVDPSTLVMCDGCQ